MEYEKYFNAFGKFCRTIPMPSIRAFVTGRNLIAGTMSRAYSKLGCAMAIRIVQMVRTSRLYGVIMSRADLISSSAKIVVLAYQVKQY